MKTVFDIISFIGLIVLLYLGLSTFEQPHEFMFILMMCGIYSAIIFGIGCYTVVYKNITPNDSIPTWKPEIWRKTYPKE